MTGSWVEIRWISIVFAILVPGFLPYVRCQKSGSTGGTSGAAMANNPAMLPVVSELVYGRMKNLTDVFEKEMKNELAFCIKNKDADWNGAFNFSKDLGFMNACFQKTKGDLPNRICTAAELKFYFISFMGASKKTTNYLKPNKNCNLTSWNDGCEPGWACTVPPNVKVDLKNSKEMPARTRNCQPCCPGFFCPNGITCMIPCPLGAYCPSAKLNKSTGICEPYNYQLPPGKPNHTCGGANTWADVLSASETFCSPGYYCPSTIKKLSCSSGHYCRMGSTSEKKCFRLSSCEANTSNQNIHAYGVMLIVSQLFTSWQTEAALSTLLIIIYNCSDQVLNTRSRKQAKSREAAAKSARETAQARERWKNAKGVAKKGAAISLQSFSRTFSRKKSSRASAFGSKGGSRDNLPPMGQESSSTGKGKKKGGGSNLTKMIRQLEEDPDSTEGFQMEVGDKNLKKVPKGKAMHTHTQIFRYAYGQIEKEKALQQENKNLTFSGVISMAQDIEIRTRPVIEVAFKDLTITLKGKNKHLLRCVSGKLMPGRVSAVMGPSGAGKTTFLSALAGKISGCTMSGSVLINGKPEPIQSYKKIIGFVPQDDVVHGNLTVEENLWFSARCRLSADMSKPDKVLVVERVIESLGLQAVRDSLVGTVEKRGISGGQRKRVNVGLEMVMEPSLLILDEPTSGLDSSSSQLLLRALRREAIEGVNICMVVHQPSYTLYRMFDDLILLAKGGLTAYHGPVKKVEEYFGGLGIHVPERVNPPDHYIDILEGITKPTGGVDRKDLPIRWMLHNGYAIPRDMLNDVDSLASSSRGVPTGEASPANNGDPTLAGELWQDVKYNVEVKRDNLQNSFSHSQDLSNRVTAGIFRQYKYYLGRVGKQRLREARIQAVDYLILLLAGACLGTLAPIDDESFGALGYQYTVIAVSLLCKIAALRSFALDKLIYRRERASGMSSMAYFLSKDTIDHFNTLVKPLVYLSMFYFFNNPRSSFQDNYIVLACLVYCVTGLAYALAIFLEPSPAQLFSVLLPVVLTLISNQEKKSHFLKFLSNFCYTKWGLEAFVISNAERYTGVWLITRCGSLNKFKYDLHDYHLCLLVLVAFGMFSRFIAYFCLVSFHKK